MININNNCQSFNYYSKSVSLRIVRQLWYCILYEMDAKTWLINVCKALRDSLGCRRICSVSEVWWQQPLWTVSCNLSLKFIILFFIYIKHALFFVVVIILITKTNHCCSQWLLLMLSVCSVLPCLFLKMIPGLCFLCFLSAGYVLCCFLRE